MSRRSIKQIRLDRLKELSKMLKKFNKEFPKTKFDLGTWVEDPNMEEYKCGTAACALGSACFHPPFMREGLKVYENFCGSYAPYYKNDDQYRAGEAFFKISPDETEWLFGPEFYAKKNGGYYSDSALPRYVTSKVVAKRVDALVKHYTKTNEPSELYEDCRYAL